MSGKLDPIVFDDVLERVVAAECCESPLPGDLFDVAPDDVVESVFLEGSVLVPNHLKLSVNLPEQKPPFQKFERKVVEFYETKVAPHEERVCVWPQLSSSYLREDPSANLYNQPWNIESKKVHYFIYSFCSSYEIASA